MGYFKETTTNPVIKVLPMCVPDIIINSNALIKMQLFVEGCNEEVGWLGTAVKQKGIIYIDDVFLFEQEVHSATTEINAEVLTAFGEEILQQPNGMELWNNIRVWGHSHVRMATTPSAQDDKQMETFAQSGSEWFIRIIANKNGIFTVDLYDYTTGIIYKDMQWEEAGSSEEQQILQQIDMLHKAIDQLRTNRVQHFTETIKEEIATKVKKKSFATTYQPYNQQHGANATRNTVTNSTVGGTVTIIDDKKKLNTGNGTNATNASVGLISTIADIYQYFDKPTLLEIAEARSYRDVVTTLTIYGYDKIFTYKDVNLIWEEALKVSDTEYFKRSGK